MNSFTATSINRKMIFNHQLWLLSSEALLFSAAYIIRSSFDGLLWSIQSACPTTSNRQPSGILSCWRIGLGRRIRAVKTATACEHSVRPQYSEVPVHLISAPSSLGLLLCLLEGAFIKFGGPLYLRKHMFALICRLFSDKVTLWSRMICRYTLES